MNDETRWKVRTKHELEKAERSRIAREKLVESRVLVAGLADERSARCNALADDLARLRDRLAAEVPNLPNHEIEAAVTTAAKQLCNEIAGRPAND